MGGLQPEALISLTRSFSRHISYTNASMASMTCVHFLLVVQEPQVLLRLWHIRENHDRVVERVLPEERLDATVGRKRAISFSLL